METPSSILEYGQYVLKTCKVSNVFRIKESTEVTDYVKYLTQIKFK